MTFVELMNNGNDLPARTQTLEFFDENRNIVAFAVKYLWFKLHCILALLYCLSS